VFRIVRIQSEWRPAAWIAAALFIVPWDVLRFSGGHPRAFAQPIVLLAVFLLLRKRRFAAALVPPVGVLFYPPAGVVALAVVALFSLERGRPVLLNAGRAAWAALSILGVGAAVLIPQLLTGTSAELISKAEARTYPEFGEHGPMHYFTSSTLDYLKNNYSGFYLQAAGSILAVAAVLLLLARPRNTTLIRWEVWSMAISSFVLFAIAHAVLFRLYLPHRYTYALLPFFCIVIALTVRPTMGVVAARSRVALLSAPALALGAGALALTVFPLGPQQSLARFGSWLEDAVPYLAVGFAVGLLLVGVLWRRASGHAAKPLAAAAAIVASSVLVAEVSFAGGAESNASPCEEASLYRYLETLPKDAIIAGDPIDMNCIPIAARRPVLISRKLYQPWNPEYFSLIRPRMFDVVRAYYGSSVGALTELRARYGADYLIVRRQTRTRVWQTPMAPFARELRRLLKSVAVPAAQRLPQRCQTWRDARLAVYSLACVSAQPSQ
jgi:hypothetical protein